MWGGLFFGACECLYTRLKTIKIWFSSKKIFCCGICVNEMYSDTHLSSSLLSSCPLIPSLLFFPNPFPFIPFAGLCSAVSVWIFLFLAEPLRSCGHMPCSSFNCSSVFMLRSRERQQGCRQRCLLITGHGQVPDGRPADGLFI